LTRHKRGKTADKVAPAYQYASVVSSSTLSDLGLPRIIVIGDEKAGKSSTLERIACVDIFPMEKKFCTRQPIHLKMRNNSSVLQPNTLFKVTIPTDTNFASGAYLHGKQVESVDEVRTILKNRMEYLKSNGIGIIPDQAIVVEIENARVPTMDLVDLPGLFEAQLDPSSNDPKNLSEMVEACTRQYLNDPNTGVVVCVIPANTENLRTSKAIRLMQTVARSSLQKSAIGVFAKSDLSYYHQWATEKENDGPLHKLESWLSRRDNENFDCLGSGCVAVMNRNTQAANPLDLQTQEVEELDYFKRNLSLKSGYILSSGKSKDGKELSNSGTECFGLAALTRKIDQVFCKHIASEWIPKELQKIQHQKSKVQEELTSLGTDPAKLTLEQFFCATDEWLNKSFFSGAFVTSDNIIQKVQTLIAQVCKDAMDEQYDFCGRKQPDINPFIMNVIRRRNALNAIKTWLSSACVLQNVTDALKTYLLSTFSAEENCEPVLLTRFDSILSLVETGIELEMHKNAPDFQRETTARVERAFGDSSTTVNHQEITRHILDGVVQWLIIPLFAVDQFGKASAESVCVGSKKRGRSESGSIPPSSYTFTRHVYQQLSAVPAERHASKRVALAASIRACEAIEVELRSFGEKHGLKSADLFVRSTVVQIDD